MATDAEKSFRLVHGLVATCKELLELEGVLRSLANQDAEISKMANARAEHQAALEAIGGEKVKARADTDKAKSDLDKELQAYRGQIEGEKKKIAATIGPDQTKLSQLEAKIETAQTDLTNTLAERRQQLGAINDVIDKARKVLTGLNEAREAARRSLGA